MVNTNLINFHDLVLITAIAIIAHFTLVPIYNKIANKDI